MKESSPTLLEWVDTPFVQCKQKDVKSIRFKVVIFKQNRQFNRYLYASPHFDTETGKFTNDQVTFRIVESKNGKLSSTELFTNDQRQVNKFELSQVDNRMVKVQILDLRRQSYTEYQFIFANVHQKHYFSELFFLGTN